MNFREKMKREIGAQVFEIPTKTKEEELEKHELGLRLFQFFEYEQDPEFAELFNTFCYKKKLERLRKEEQREER